MAGAAFGVRRLARGRLGLAGGAVRVHRAAVREVVAARPVRVPGRDPEDRCGQVPQDRAARAVRRRVGRGLLVRLGFSMGYPPPGTSPLELISLAQEAERLCYDSAWAAEAWGTDSVTVLSWLPARNSSVKGRAAILPDPAPAPPSAA